RTIVVPDLDRVPAALPDLVDRADSPWGGVTACAGRPHCAKAHADVQRLAHDAAPALGTGLPVHWAGCERRCGQPAERHVEVLAGAGGRFTVGLAGREQRDLRPGQVAAAVSAWR